MCGGEFLFFMLRDGVNCWMRIDLFVEVGIGSL